jgi:branched-chain amino acid transport system substrate-binding protein
MPNPQLAQRFIDEWRKRGNPEPGMTEGFRGVDGIMTIGAAINKAGNAEPMAIRDALWTVEVQGINGPIKFDKEGPAGKESGQSSPSIFLVTIQNGTVALPPFIKTG